MKQIAYPRLVSSDTLLKLLKISFRYFWRRGEQSPSQVHNLRTAARGYPFCAGVYICNTAPPLSVIWAEGNTGVYISVRNRYLFPPPPFWKWYFFPLSRHVIFWLPLRPFCLNSSLFCIYFTLFLIFFPLSSFFFPLLPFSFLFLLFSFTFFLFFSSPFHIFSPNDIGWYFPLPQGGGYFPIYRPLGEYEKREAKKMEM